MAQGIKNLIWKQRDVVSSDSDTEKKNFKKIENVLGKRSHSPSLQTSILSFFLTLPCDFSLPLSFHSTLVLSSVMIECDTRFLRAEGFIHCSHAV